jgi:putative transposase
VKNLCTRKIEGYTFSDRIDTQLTLAALDMAHRRRRPAEGFIFHSGYGVQYPAWAFRERLDAYGIRQSMSRRGDPYNNAVAENFFSCLKCELVHLKQYLTHIEAQTDIFATSRHSTTLRVPILPLVWMSPAHFETAL